MKYFTVASEDRKLNAVTRTGLRGSFIKLTVGVTHYELRGPADGPLVVLVPGLTIPLFYWDTFAEELHARGLQTLAFSAYGRGYSERVAVAYDEALFALQLQELLTALDIPERVHLVGTSMGALVALGYVVNHPARVASLTLVGPAGLGTDNARAQRLLRNDVIAKLVAKRFGRRILLGHLGHNVADPALAAPLTAMIADAYRYEGSMYGFFSTLQNFPLSNRTALFRAVSGWRGPDLADVGTDDQVTPITGWDTAQEALRPKQTHVLDCGHMAPYERPTETADHLVAFLAAQSDRSTR